MLLRETPTELILRDALDVLRAGNVTLAFDDPAGLELYIGERKIDPVTAQTRSTCRTERTR